ncbi:helix-turn-helix transcriptional regulator [Rossellomorea oryzaecorticis]|uniref:Helix-turn-helix transcriptional regulator n=1 Tax=Rossellomorea oryzaecorticis TaxID=1396505 RepID=A0ABW8VP50_9BACI|nr:WYL domain-containing protein [[Bacillus] enclensis]MBH9968666.1 WYL domain-containing protein [[Bacillus] enclensis]QTC43194.1 WYL domain-containing protein [Bacillus sp. V3]QWC21359.1 WYL domain-containing protein [Bacillus haikouensis]
MTRIDNKERLLRLMTIFSQETDEDHELSLDEIIHRFQQIYGPDVKLNKNSLKDDINHLINHSFDVTINQEKDGLPKYYSHQYRLFELYELRMLVDAVVSAKFITKQETRQLIGKIRKLTSNHQGKKLQNEIQVDSSIKSESPYIRLAIHDLHQAISERRVITFQYGRYDIDKNFNLSHEGSLYKVKPYALTWANDFYYLIAYYYEAGEIRHYRVDRLRNVSILEESFPYESFDVSKYVQSTFHMFAGDEEWIKVKFHNGLINVIIDKFGKEADIRKYDDEHFILSTKARISGGLVNWILNFGSQAKVISPNSLFQTVKEEVTKMNNLYEN